MIAAFGDGGPSCAQVVLSILRDAGYEQTEVMTDADVVLVNTCAIREGPRHAAFLHVIRMRHHIISMRHALINASMLQPQQWSPTMRHEQLLQILQHSLPS